MKTYRKVSLGNKKKATSFDNNLKVQKLLHDEKHLAKKRKDLQNRLYFLGGKIPGGWKKVDQVI